MPHVFLQFKSHPSTKACFEEYAKFILDVTSGKSIETRFEMVDGKGVIEAEPLNTENYSIPYTKEEVCPVESRLI